jgi:hypothetical protein
LVCFFRAGIVYYTYFVKIFLNVDINTVDCVSPDEFSFPGLEWFHKTPTTRRGALVPDFKVPISHSEVQEVGIILCKDVSARAG